MYQVKNHPLPTNTTQAREATGMKLGGAFTPGSGGGAAPFKPTPVKKVEPAPPPPPPVDPETEALKKLEFTDEKVVADTKAMLAELRKDMEEGQEG